MSNSFKRTVANAAPRPIDRSGGPYRLGVIGDPIAHSLSPALHQPALEELGVPARFERWHTPAAGLNERIASLREPGALGASVTVPHKVAVMALVDDVSPAARRAGAVNTVVNREGALFGDNTDIYGFQTSVAEAVGENVPAVALVLGAGGAARAVVLALEALGVTEIVVANRDAARAARLVADLEAPALRTESLAEATWQRELPRAALLVNATSMGWHAGEQPIDLALLSLLPTGAVVADLTYRDTDLLLAAAARGLTVVDGLPMLVHQGARAFTLWTGYEAPLATMLAAARSARAAN
jgi:shikimate dehydrogenase